MSNVARIPPPDVGALCRTGKRPRLAELTYLLRYSRLWLLAGLDVLVLLVIEVHTGLGVYQPLHLHDAAFVYEEHERCDTHTVLIHEVFLRRIRDYGQGSPRVGHHFQTFLFGSGVEPENTHVGVSFSPVV